MKRHNCEDLVIFRSKLEVMLQVDQKHYTEVIQQIDNISEKGKDENSLDNNSSNMEAERLISRKNRILKHMQFLNNALRRLENGTYGICLETGELIEKNRLMAVPTTTLSITGKIFREQSSRQHKN